MRRERRPKLVAIVDDDASVLRSLKNLIESAGLNAKCFGSAEEFLDSGVCPETGCLITDIRMPRMSGLELQARLKADKCKVPIIFITAHGDARMRVQAMREGAVEFFTKPFDDVRLLDKVRIALEM